MNIHILTRPRQLEKQSLRLYYQKACVFVVFFLALVSESTLYVHSCTEYVTQYLVSSSKSARSTLFLLLNPTKVFVLGS